ncbi:MAG: tetratricopeptide repeat protein [Nitrospirae bacterium]|nr:tetratricopeptide repeat protein [Nitrospirota bacterium]
MRQSVIKILALLIFLTAMGSAIAHAGIFQDPVRQGNQLNKEGKYDEAIRKYDEALKKTPESDVLNYNTGTAYYNKGDYQKAVESFTKSMSTKDPSIEKRSNYNAGNAQYMIGKTMEEENPQASMSAYESALQYFKRAIELDDTDSDARRNYEITSKKIHQLKEQPQKPKNNKDDKKDEKKNNKKDNKDKENNKNDKDKEQNKDAKDREKDKDKDKEKDKDKDKENDKDKDEKGHGKDAKDQPQTTPAPSPEKPQDLKGVKPPPMTKEEANQMLEGLKQDNVPRSMIDDKEKKGGYPNVQKDW